MRGVNRLQQMAANLLELPKDAVLDLPRITLIGGLQILIENHTGIREFTENQIRLTHQKGEIQIFGRQMVIKYLQPGEMLIEGEIVGIKYV